MKPPRPITIFYHVYMGGGCIPVEQDNVWRIVSEQFNALISSELLASAKKLFVGVAGDDIQVAMVAELFKGYGEIFRAVGVGELPTMKAMKDYAQQNPDHLILYIHTKGAIHNGSAIYELWRKCMEKWVIFNWRKCVKDLERGYDTVGAHWLTPAKYSFIGPVPYWGGNFFWAQAKFMDELPAIDVNADRYQAEVWIGKSKRKPNVFDYARHFPMSGCTS